MTTSSRSLDASLAAVQAFLDELASDRPTPAGGAAAAVTVALGASLGVMAAGISDRPDAEARLLALQRSAVRLAADDCEAFAGVLAARRRPPDQSNDRQSAWERATSVPIAVGEVAADVSAELEALRDAVPASLSCDVGAARLLVIAGAVASMANARENVGNVEPGVVRSSLQRRLDELDRRLGPEPTP